MIVTLLLLIVSLVPVTWVLYLAIMTLERARDGGLLPKPALIAGTGLLMFGYLCDCMLNLVVGTPLFMELPKEWLLSPRVARLQDEGSPYRKTVASWICKNLLNPFDPSGCHCKESLYK